MLNRILYSLGFSLRETGQALDRLGCSLQGSNAFREQLNRHRRVMGLFSKHPAVAPEAFVAPSAHVIGDVTVAPGASIWYGAVVRGDVNRITIGADSCVQDRVVLHCANLPKPFPTVIGNKCTIESGAIVHASRVEDNVIVGAGARVLDGSLLQKNSIVAAGSVVVPNTIVPSGQLWAGSPAKFVRELTAEEISNITATANAHADLAKVHRDEHNKGVDQLVLDEEIRLDLEERHPEYTSRIGHNQ